MSSFNNTFESIDAGVKDLLSKMTLDEKIAQMGAVFGAELIEAGKFSPQKAEIIIKNGIGQITRPLATTGLQPNEVAAFMNEIQRFLVENTRLGVPAIMHEECLSGFMAIGATIFPQIISLASTWEPELVEKMAGVIRMQMRAAGEHLGLAPVVDVARDPRWGRVEETFGEDPYLVARMGTSYVRGLQGDDLREGIIATLKHFPSHGLSEGGLNRAPNHIPPRMLREVLLYPYKVAIKEGGALAILTGYHEIDGIPSTANQELLTDVLRGEWGFAGITVSDYYAIDLLQACHHIAPDKAGAAERALAAGIDLELPRYDCYAEPLREQVEKGLVSEGLVDRAVSRVLRLKFMLGLFEGPYVEPGKTAEAFDLPGHRRLAREAARKSIVLLKNEGNLLPLNRNQENIAVIGPNADSRRNLLGDYTYPASLEIMAAMRPHAPDGQTEPDEAAIQAAVQSASDETQKAADAPAAEKIGVPVVSILEGIRAKIKASTKLPYAEGCEVNSASKEGFDKALEAAKAADVAIVVVGGKSGMSLDNTCGELRDRAELGLPGVQEELVKAIYETGTPVVLILVNGRPYTLEWIAEKIPAVIEAWLPGEEGGNAVADVLFGDYNPGGKLPMSFPRKVGQIPVYYSHKPSGGRSQMWGDYVDTPASPLFEFGFGLSYTTFDFSNLRVEPNKVPLTGNVSIKVDITNTGTRAGEEVLQLYINDIVASVTRPVKELKGFKRIYLEPAEKRTVEFDLPVELLAFYDRDMKLIVEPGAFKVMVGHSSSDIALEGVFEVED